MARKKTATADGTPEGPKRPTRSGTTRTAPTRRKARTSGSKAAAEKSARKGTTSPWEWAAAAVGAATFVLLVGFLVHAGLTRPESPYPDIVARAGPAIRLDSGTFLVPLSAVNLGHDTGANVTVRGSLRDAGGALVEESSTTFDDVAQHSSAAGGLYFVTDPRTGTLTLRVEGYADP